ncbi:type I polyketide synthase [Calothrix sp. PCC 6303]|uniref:type I polyketide synthase n=1 Tax=Calothrix sp. PCC 6303 TaxID=1170562 RepID=UPI0002A0243C|nr:type I polyketide synthase [Calothrix sp. PCC 6303]AFZ01576.1 6-deoxyerythronolide-B synthase, Aspartate racemase [Calothrix sp. PCC 6303]
MSIESNIENINESIEGIAIIGMSGRFPGANNVESFWQNLCNGVESLSFFSHAELVEAGVPASLLDNPNYVKAGGILEDIDLFDAGFFDINPKEAEVTDPQQRLFLESAWQALENAGYDSTKCDARIGVYAGASLNNYLSFDVHQDGLGSAESYQKLIGNDKDFLSTRVAYKLNLKGPSITVQTACSTSLVATILASQSLQSYQCDMALAGGVSIRVPQKTGFLHQQGGTLSPDGHCRAFDANAQGTTIGSGVGVVVLKRLSDAIADRDYIYAVIKGTAINNDGSGKVGFTAPSVDGQAEAIAEAIALAEIEPETIQYIEAHGTGTSLGDPIEIAALTKVFRASTEKSGFCAIGSVKTNIGHLDAAAGIAGLIKTSLALKHQLIPPSLNFRQPNPQIDFANSPFFVNTQLKDWKPTFTPRRAGVSSLGMGGTNAHVVLEEAPIFTDSSPSRGWQLLLLSAKSASALEAATKNLTQYLKLNPHANLADVAYTLQLGRRDFAHRRILVCSDTEDAIQELSTPVSQRIFNQSQESRENPSLAFMFPGQGSQYVDMGKELYTTEPLFRHHVEHCCSILMPHLGLDLQSLIYPSESEKNLAAEKLKQTCFAQPAIFVIEYALAQLWISWGIVPQAMIGHSIGEYVAATVAGVFSLADALFLVANRGKLMQQLPGGTMLSVQLSELEIKPLLTENISLAAVNTTSYCTVSGATEAIEELQRHLQEIGVSCRRLHTSHAFHSPMMEPILETFRELVQTVTLNPPQIPFISNVSGTWISASEATNPNYWANHLRQPVHFCQGLTELLKTPGSVLLEVGAGRTLSTFARQQRQQELTVLTSLPHPQEQQSEVAFILSNLGRLWMSGIQINRSGFYIREQRHRLPLPTYPFERQRYWLEPTVSPRLLEVNSAQYIVQNRRYSIDLDTSSELEKPLQPSLSKRPNITDWFYLPVWKQSIPLEISHQQKETQQKLACLVFADKYEFADQFKQLLTQQGEDVITVEIGDEFCQLDRHRYVINPQRPEDYEVLLKDLQKRDFQPNTICHYWSIAPNDILLKEESQLTENYQYFGFYSLLYLAQAIGKQDSFNPCKLLVVTNNLYSVIGEEKLCPQKATILGACKVIPKEYGNINCSLVDLVIESVDSSISLKVLNNLLAEIGKIQNNQIVAYRGSYRWLQSFEPVALDDNFGSKAKFKQGGVYLITGGLGGIGLVLAEHLAKTVQAKLILIGRGGLPERCQWEQYQLTHGSEDRISRKIQKMRSLEESGMQFMVTSADVTDSQQMQAVVNQALQKFGQINGVIHAAGVAGGGVTQLKTQEMVRNVLAAKVDGTLILDDICQQLNLDFFVVCSSKTAILGEFGQIDYCAANAFLDAFATSRTASSGLTISISWDTWQEVGLAVETVLPDGLKQKREEMIKKGILPEEGIEVFNRVMGSNLPHVVISTQDLPSLIQQSNADKYLEDALQAGKLSSVNLSKAKHSRPNLGNTYVTPQTKVECILTDIWQEILGIDQIGIHDNFFELGGNSINTIQIASNANKAGLKLTTQQFFQHQTIAELATNLALESIVKTQENLEIQEVSDLHSNSIKSSLMQEKQAEDIYELTPVQKGMLFHCLYESELSLYFFQHIFNIQGNLDLEAFTKAWQLVIDRHPILRTGFYWHEIENPLQIVYNQVQVPLDYYDWCDIDPATQKSQFTSLILSDRQNNFDFAQPCLMRHTVIRLSHDSYQYVWSMNHIIIDGWGGSLVFQEFVEIYGALCQNQEICLTPTRPFRDYINWLQQQDISKAEVFWRQTLAGIEAPTPLTYIENINNDLSPTPEIRYSEEIIQLSLKNTQALNAFATQHHLTLATIINGVWAILLSRYSCCDQVLYGCTVTGRPPQMDGVESMVGMFVNTLPIHVDVDGEQSLLSWLQRFQLQLVEARNYEYTPLTEAHKWSEIPRNLPLFETIVVIENFPVSEFIKDWQGNIEFQHQEVYYRNNYPLNLVVYPNKELLIAISYDSRRFATDTIIAILKDVEIFLNDLVVNNDKQIKSLSFSTQRQQNITLTLEQELSALEFI